MKRLMLAAAGIYAAMVGTPAAATVMLATWTGAVTSGYDTTGFYGFGPSTSLIGKSYTAQFVFDTNIGHVTTTPHSDERRGGPAYAVAGIADPGPFTVGRFTLNGRSVDIGDAYAGVAHTGEFYSSIVTNTPFYSQPGFGSLALGTTGTNDYPTLLTTEFSRSVSGSGNVQFANGLYFMNLGVSSLSVEVRPGELERPILPNPPGSGTPPPGGGFAFDFNVFGTGERTFVDPLIAAGYDYSVLSGQSILDVLFPTIAGDTDGFQVYSADGLTLLGTAVAGTPFSFGPGGVSGFRVRDIDGALNPADGTAFMAGLTFSAPGRVSLTQTPFVVNTDAGAVPEPGAWALMMVGLGTAGAVLRRQRRVRAV